MYMKKWLLSVIPVFALGCAYTPPTEQITQAPLNDISLQEVSADPERFVQSTVRWGGRIIKRVEVGEGEQSRLHLEVLQHPLDDKGKPIPGAAAGGRFIARIDGPYKKSAYYQSRLVTVTGVIAGVEDYPLASGEVQRLPVLASTDNYAWRRDYDDHGHHHSGPSIFYRIGIGTHHRGAGIGVIFH